MDIIRGAEQLEDIALQMNKVFSKGLTNLDQEKLDSLKDRGKKTYTSLLPLIHEAYKHMPEQKKARASRRALLAIHEQGFFSYNENGALWIVESIESGKPTEVYGISKELRSIAAAIRAVEYEKQDPSKLDNYVEFVKDAYIIQPRPGFGKKICVWKDDGRGVFRKWSAYEVEDENIPNIIDGLVGNKVFFFPADAQVKLSEPEVNFMNSRHYERFTAKDAEDVKKEFREFINYSPMS